VATLFSYVVDHDLGFAPNPASGYCTLVHCKFEGKSGRRNIVELAKQFHATEYIIAFKFYELSFTSRSMVGRLQIVDQ
jgi:hypothetical protein